MTDPAPSLLSPVPVRIAQRVVEILRDDAVLAALCVGGIADAEADQVLRSVTIQTPALRVILTAERRAYGPTFHSQLYTTINVLLLMKTLEETGTRNFLRHRIAGRIHYALTRYPEILEAEKQLTIGFTDSGQTTYPSPIRGTDLIPTTLVYVYQSLIDETTGELL